MKEKPFDHNLNAIIYPNIVERWGLLEISVKGISSGNPFTERTIHGMFTGSQECIQTDGFYDGNGIYKIRFMPSFEGSYTFQLKGNFTNETFHGSFEVCSPGKENHGPVRVANTWHFIYEDGTPYYVIGTTCYVWNLQSDELIQQTLNSLRNSAFNKIRFCIFPKHYDYNLTEPRSYPYVGSPMDSKVLTRENFREYTGKTAGNHFNMQTFNPEHFRHIEYCIMELQKMGIEADLIVMHPYDRWGFSQMTREEDTLYWNYIIARFAAYRNVWWSLANEFDFLIHKSICDWEYYAQILCEKDPYRHLRSIHNGPVFYDYNRPWITHCSLQKQDLYKTAEMTDIWRERWNKPVVMDEMVYEGDIPLGWGNITGEELVRRFWETVVRGGYPGHGETFINEDNILWWSHGGTLHGESHKRFHLLLEIMKETPGIGLYRYHGVRGDELCAVPESEHNLPIKSYYLYYCSFMRPAFKEFYVDDETSYEVTIIDTWEMKRETVGIFKGKFRIALPGKPYIAIQLKLVK